MKILKKTLIVLLETIAIIILGGMTFIWLYQLENLRWLAGFLIGGTLFRQLWSFWLNENKRVPRCIILSILLTVSMTTIDPDNLAIWHDIQLAFWIGCAFGHISSIGRN